MGSWLPVCAGMECHKVVNIFVLYYMNVASMILSFQNDAVLIVVHEVRRHVQICIPEGW
jgi:hypothetical protein